MVANMTGSPSISPASTALSMFFLSAEANTSAGAPPFIWSTSPEEPSKVYVAGAISGNTLFSEAAANTTVFSVLFSPEVAELDADAVGAGLLADGVAP